MKFGTRKRNETSGNLARRSPVEGSGRSSVFSYYAGSRSQAEQGRRTSSPSRSDTRSGASRQLSAIPPTTSSSRLRRIRPQMRHVPSYIALVAVLIGVIWTLSLSSSPRVIVEKVPGISPERDSQQYIDGVTDIWSGSWRNASKLTVNTGKAEHEVLSKYTELSEVRVQLPLLGRRPTIILVPTSAAFRLVSAGKTYYVSPDGKALVDTSIVDTGADLLTVQDGTNAEVTPGAQVVTSETARFLVQLDMQLRAEKVTSPVLTLSGQAVNQITMKTPDHDYYVKFQVDDPATVRQAVGSYIAVRNRLSSSGTRPGEYIDVRIPDKVFYK